MVRKTGYKCKNIPIVVIGEGITEYYYMLKLKRFITLKPYKIKPSYFNKNTGYKRLGDTINDVVKQYNEVIVIVLFDLDVTKRDERVKEHLEKVKRKYKGKKQIIFCGSMPDIEYWFLLHFTPTTKELSSENCLLLLKHYIADYEKAEKYLKQDKWMNILMQDDNLMRAVDRAKQNFIHNNCSYTDIYKAIEILTP